MRVQAREHAVQRVLDQLAVAHGLDVFGAHPAEDVAEQGQQAIGFGAAAIGLGEGRDDGHADQRRGDEAGGEGARDGGGGPDLELHARGLTGCESGPGMGIGVQATAGAAARERPSSPI
jgi:hypothetical protein